MTNKYGPVRCRGPLLVQIGRNRGSRRGRQGQSIGASALGADKLDRAIAQLMSPTCSLTTSLDRRPRSIKHRTIA